MAPEEHYGWLVVRSGCVLTADFRALEVVDEHGAVRGMVGYDSWCPNSVQVHMAVDKPMAWKYLVPAIFEFPFLECNRGIAVGVIPAHKAMALKTVRTMGFREVARIQDGFKPGEDLVIHQLRREECKYLHGWRRAA
jgi:hypothetical protein